MNRGPKISVITPSFNQGTYIRGCIESIISQNYDNYEHIIVDGGSTDETLDVINGFRHSNMRLICEKDFGQSHAFNKGLLTSDGEIICWLNSDDYLLPRAFFAVVDAYSEKNKPQWMIGSGYSVDVVSGSIICKYPGTSISVVGVLSRQQSFLQPACFHTRSAFAIAGLLDIDNHWSMDVDLSIRLLMHDVLPVIIEQDLAAATVHRDAKTSSKWWLCEYETMSIAEKYRFKLGPVYKDIVKARAGHYSRILMIFAMNEASQGSRSLALKLMFRALLECPTTALTKNAIITIRTLLR